MKLLLFFLVNFTVFGWYLLTFRGVKQALFLLLTLSSTVYIGKYNWSLGIDLFTLNDVALLGLLVFTFIRKPPKLTGFAKVIAILGSLFVIWSLLAGLIAATNKNYALGGVIIYLKSFLIFFLLYLNVNTLKELNAALYALFVSLFFEATLGFYQWRFATTGLAILGDTFGYYRSAGTFKLPNLFGAYIIMSFFLPAAILGFQGFKKDSRTVFLSLVIVFGVFSILASYSRSAWIGLVLQVIILFLLLLLRREFKRKAFKLLIFVLILFMPVIAIYGNRIAARFEKASDSWEKRNELVDAAVETIQKNPVFGVGLKNYAKYGYPKWLNRPESARAPENSFLLIAVESGLPAVLLFAAIIGMTILKGFQLTRKSKVKYFGVIEAAITTSIIGFIVQNIAVPEFRHFPIQLVFWYEIAMLAKMEQLEKAALLKLLKQRKTKLLQELPLANNR